MTAMLRQKFHLYWRIAPETWLWAGPGRPRLQLPAWES